MSYRNDRIEMPLEMWMARTQTLENEVARLQAELVKANRYVDDLQKQHIVTLAEKQNLTVDNGQLRERIERCNVAVRALQQENENLKYDLQQRTGIPLSMRSEFSG